jgi:xylulokinase
VYNATIVALEQNEGGVVGAAILAGLSAGVWSNAYEATDTLVRARAKYEPDAGRTARYDRSYRVFEYLHDTLQAPFERLGRARNEEAAP